jgi:hypothetical protein
MKYPMWVLVVTGDLSVPRDADTEVFGPFADLGVAQTQLDLLRPEMDTNVELVELKRPTLESAGRIRSQTPESRVGMENAIAEMYRQHGHPDPN